MALAATTVWEARTTGSDTNGGGFDPGVAAPGTDYSVQDAAQVVFSDLVIGGTNTQLTSAANPFTAAHAGNFINITGGGGFTTGWYEILSVSGVTATMDRAVGTGGSTGGTGNLGGGFASPGQAMSVATASNTLYIKNTGTKYVLSASLNVSGGRINVTVGGSASNAPFQIIGYKTNRTLINSDSPPQLDAGAAVGAFAHIACNSSFIRIRNLNMTNSVGGATGTSYSIFLGGSGQYNVAERCISDQMPYGYYFNGNEDHCEDCVATRFTLGGFFNAGVSSANRVAFCYAANGTAAGFYGIRVNHVIAYNNTGSASDGITFPTAPAMEAYNSISYGSGRHGFQLYYDTLCANCVAINNGVSTGGSGYGFQVGSLGVSVGIVLNCAGFGNKTADLDPSLPSWAVQGFIHLTGDPFTAAASGNFTRNNTAGAGQSLAQAAFPQAFNTLPLTVNFEDINAVQAAGNSGTYVTVTSSADPSALKQSVTFTAAVTVSGGGTATGTIQFAIDGTVFGSAVALVSGSATSGATTTLTSGTHTVTATYIPTGSFQSSVGTLQQVVNKRLPVGRLFRYSWRDDPIGFGQELAALLAPDANLSQSVNVLRDVLPHMFQ